MIGAESPNTVLIRPPGVIVCVPCNIESDARFAVNAVPAIVWGSGPIVELGEKKKVEVPIIRADPKEARDTGVPETEIGSAPGISVWVPMINSP